METTQKYLRVTVVLTMVAALSACGVKSAPAEVDGSTYPRVYPAPTEDSRAAGSPTETRRTGGTVYTRRPAKDASGVYTPPPPATEILAQ
jgi:hypothetical protein